MCERVTGVSSAVNVQSKSGLSTLLATLAVMNVMDVVSMVLFTSVLSSTCRDEVVQRTKQSKVALAAELL